MKRKTTKKKLNTRKRYDSEKHKQRKINRDKILFHYLQKNLQKNSALKKINKRMKIFFIHIKHKTFLFFFVYI